MSYTVHFIESETEAQALYGFREAIASHHTDAHAPATPSPCTDERDAYAHNLIAQNEAGDIIGALRVNYGGDAPFSAAHERTYRLSRFSRIVPVYEIVVHDRFVVDNVADRASVAAALMERSVAFLAEVNAQLAFGQCHPNELPLYTAFGWRTYIPNFDQTPENDSIPLIFVTEDIEHLQRVAAPTLTLLAKRACASTVPQKVRPLLGA